MSDGAHRVLPAGWERLPSVWGGGQEVAADPYVRWGDTQRLNFGPLQSVAAAEFARIDLPRPLLCRLNLHVDVQPVDVGASVEFSAIEYAAGTGSSAPITRRVFFALPQVPSLTQPNGTPLDAEYYVPIQHLNGRVFARAVNCQIVFTLWLAPVSLEQL